MKQNFWKYPIITLGLFSALLVTQVIFTHHAFAQTTGTNTTYYHPAPTATFYKDDGISSVTGENQVIWRIKPASDNYAFTVKWWPTDNPAHVTSATGNYVDIDGSGEYYFGIAPSQYDITKVYTIELTDHDTGALFTGSEGTFNGSAVQSQDNTPYNPGGTASGGTNSEGTPVTDQHITLEVPSITNDATGYITFKIKIIPDIAMSEAKLELHTGTTAGTLSDIAQVYDGAVPTSGNTLDYTYKLTEEPLPTTIYYKFVETTTNTDSGEQTYNLTQGQGDASSTDNDGTCNPTYNSTVAQAVTSDLTLCSNGTMSGFTAADATNGPWTWSCLPVLTGGATASCTATLTGTNGNQTATSATTTTNTSNDQSSKLQNPFKSLDSFPKIFTAVFNNIVLPIAIPFIALAIMYSGFLFIVARRTGRVYTLDKAKTVFMYTMIGAALILGAFIIANALQGTLTAITGMAPSVITQYFV